MKDIDGVAIARIAAMGALFVLALAAFTPAWPVGFLAEIAMIGFGLGLGRY